MTPEEKARQNIDRQLAECGWIIQDMSDMNIMARLGVAVREFQLTTGEADYGLYIDGKDAGVIEAKKEGETLTGRFVIVDAVGQYKQAKNQYAPLDCPATVGVELAATNFSVTADTQSNDNETVSDKALAVGSLRNQYRRLAPRRSHNPQLREILLRPEHQVIDRFTRDQLLTSSFDHEARQRAETPVTRFHKNVSGKALAAGADNKDEIEAISILYSRPYSAGLRYSQVKELARRLSIKPFHIDESQPRTLLRLWQAFGTVAPDKVDTGSGKHCKHIVDLVSLVRHAIDPESPLRPVGQTVEERFTEWLSERQTAGGEFTEEQMQWLLAIKDHIASSLMIEQDDFEYAPVNQFGGIRLLDLQLAA